MPYENHHSRKRSRSPHRSERRPKHRSRSPPKQKYNLPAKALPLGARPLSRHDLSSYRPMFALYLDIQKQLDIEDLDEHELKGRWKSFVGKWNRGELAEGWYDPTTLQKAKASAATESQAVREPAREQQHSEPLDEGDEEDEFGPSLPQNMQYTTQSVNRPAHALAPGASIPSLDDLRDRDERAREEADRERDEQRADLRYERQLDRRLQKDRLQEIAPRAEAGTRERQLENKREKADSNRAFASAKDGGDVELRDADIMGGDDSLGEVKRMKRENERRKNERELRKEEILRARKAEREIRLAGLKAKEDQTMAMLKEIARAKYGGGGSES